MTPQQTDNLPDMLRDAQYYAKEVYPLTDSVSEKVDIVTDFLSEDWGITPGEAKPLAILYCH